RSDVANALNCGFILTWLEVLDAFFEGFFLRAQVSGDTDVARTFVTLATDGTSNGDHRHCAEADTVRAETQHLDHVAPALHTTICPQLHIVAQSAFSQRPMCQPNANLGRQSHVTQGMCPRRACATFVSG